MEITSRNNELIKEIIKLKDKKQRDNTGLILLEGYKLFEEALKSNLKVKHILTTKDYFDNNESLKKYSSKIIFISETVCEKLSFTKSHLNFFSVVEKPKNTSFNTSFVILDNIQDPQNLGAIIRTCVATNIRDIYSLNSVDEFNDKTIRASMGNVFKVFIKHIDINELKEICKNKEVYSANLNGENLFTIKKPNGNFGLILGSEGQGVSKEVENFATKIITIPMQNNTESLNVAVSFSVIAFNLINNN